MSGQDQPISAADQLEAEVTAVIEDFNGDPRAAIRAMLVEQEILEQRIAIGLGPVVRIRPRADRCRYGTVLLICISNFGARQCDTAIQGVPGVP